ncbi:hypothetical protein GCM10010439_16390 [Actinocorallia aurantiaca]|uniref:Uncharacterized protein n=1 Tax=Actinocorallia aurantiaca TaxID=46204 RepID=A0ABP6GJD4_9ACTN
MLQLGAADLVEQGLLVADVVVQRAPLEADLLFQQGHARAVVAVPREEAGGCLEDAFTLRGQLETRPSLVRTGTEAILRTDRSVRYKWDHFLVNDLREKNRERTA